MKWKSVYFREKSFALYPCYNYIHKAYFRQIAVQFVGRRRSQKIDIILLSISINAILAYYFLAVSQVPSMLHYYRVLISGTSRFASFPFYQWNKRRAKQVNTCGFSPVFWSSYIESRFSFQLFFDRYSRLPNTKGIFLLMIRFFM